MSWREQYKRIFGIGPTGVVATLPIWGIFYGADRWLQIPPMPIHPVLRWVLLLIFLMDVVYLVGGSLKTLKIPDRGRTLVVAGPYQFVRHPLYSALIYSTTGILAFGLRSWGLLLSVVPLSLFWSWHVRKEEAYLLERFGEEYHQYMETTGQFFPSWKNLKNTQPEKD